MSAVRAAGAFLALCAATLLAPSESAANKVGVAAAVNPDAFSGGKQIRIGKSIFYNERITTDANGVVQVLLVDGSTFTVGKNSNVVIDRFVYNPNTKTGEVVATFSKGSMRFIGGKISKNPGGVTVKTPEGSLAIRGGMFQGSLSPRPIFSFLFGKEMIFTGLNGRVYTVYQPGYSLALNGGQPVIRPTTPADIQAVMSDLTNSNVQPVAANQQNLPPQPSYVFTPFDFSQLIADATATRIDGEIRAQLEAFRNMKDPEPVVNGDSIDSTIGGFGAGLVTENGGETFGLVGSTLPTDFTYDEETDVITLTLRDVESGGPISRGVLTFNPAGANNWTLSQLQLFNQSGIPVQVDEAIGQAQRQTDLLCAGCTFMEWGTFGASYGYIEDPQYPYPTNESIDLGFWVGGRVTAVKDLPVMGTASFKGTAFGTIQASGLQGQQVGRGDLGMSWNFAKRSGQFSITDFNADPIHELPDLNVTGTMTMPGNLNRFSGDLSGTLGPANNPVANVSGGAFGSFVTDGKRPAAGVVGNWGVQTTNPNVNAYRAIGIFGAAAKR